MEIKRAEVLHTPFGNAKINAHGYYQLMTGKQRGKYLHRLLFENFYKMKIPKKYIIHHKNGNRIDNCILNLQLVKLDKHTSIHNLGRKLSNEHKQKLSEAHTGKKHSDETKQKMSKIRKGKPCLSETRNKISIAESKTRNTSGYYRVVKQNCETCNQGFVWCYRYKIDGKPKIIKSVDIKKLEQKVKAQSLDWIKYED